GEGTRSLIVLARDRGTDELARTRLVYGLELGADVIALRIFKENDRAFRRHEEVACRIAQEIAKHVPRSGRVSLIVGVEQQYRAIIRALHPIAQALEPLLPELEGVDRWGLGIRQPHRIRRRVADGVAHSAGEVDVVDTI